MKNLAVIIVALSLAGCGDITEVAATGDASGDAGAAGAGGGATGGAGGDTSARGGSGGPGGSQGAAGAGPSGSAGSAPGGATGTAGAGGAPPPDAGSAPCPPSDAACPAGTTCMPLPSSSNWGCFCPGSPEVAYCGAGCVDLQRDALNCGSCRHACGQGQSCQAGACR